MKKFRNKFKIDQLQLIDFEYWILSVRPQQTTIGSLVISLKRSCSSVAELLPEETEELAGVFSRTAHLIRNQFSFDKINYLCLMMIDNQVHFHVIPRYSTPVKFFGKEFKDTGWPGLPDFADQREYEEIIAKEVKRVLKEGLEDEK